jgi:hypothetical protein
MDPAFVEQITKLVLQKLREQIPPPSLSEQEINRWNEITASMKKAWGNPLPHHVSGDSIPKPLTPEEIARWNEITGSFQGRKAKATGADGMVKIHRFTP